MEQSRNQLICTILSINKNNNNMELLFKCPDNTTKRVGAILPDEKTPLPTIILSYSGLVDYESFKSEDDFILEVGKVFTFFKEITKVKERKVVFPSRTQQAILPVTEF